MYPSVLFIIQIHSEIVIYNISFTHLQSPQSKLFFVGGKIQLSKIFISFGICLYILDILDIVTLIASITLHHGCTTAYKDDFCHIKSISMI